MSTVGVFVLLLQEETEETQDKEAAGQSQQVPLGTGRAGLSTQADSLIPKTTYFPRDRSELFNAPMDQIFPY